jgi:hypothetical protein
MNRIILSKTILFILFILSKKLYLFSIGMAFASNLFIKQLAKKPYVNTIGSVEYEEKLTENGFCENRSLS